MTKEDDNNTSKSKSSMNGSAKGVISMRSTVLQIVAMLLTILIAYIITGLAKKYLPENDHLTIAIIVLLLLIVGILINRAINQKVQHNIRIMLCGAVFFIFASGCFLYYNTYKSKSSVEKKFARSLAEYAKSPRYYFDAKVFSAITAFSEPEVRTQIINKNSRITKMRISLFKAGIAGVSETELVGTDIGTRDKSDKWFFVFGADAEYTDSPDQFVRLYDLRAKRRKPIEFKVERIGSGNTYTYKGSFEPLGGAFNYTRWTCYPRSLASRVDGMLFALDLFELAVDTLQVDFYSCEEIAKISLQMPDKFDDGVYSWIPAEGTDVQETSIDSTLLPSLDEVLESISCVSSGKVVFGYSYTVIKPKNRPYVLTFSLGPAPSSKKPLPAFDGI